MDALLGKPIDVALQTVWVNTEHSLNNPQVTFIVDFRSRGEGLKRLYDLDSDPFILVLYFSNDYLFESLETSLLGDCQHAVVPDFELVAIYVCKLQLRLLLLV